MSLRGFLLLNVVSPLIGSLVVIWLRAPIPVPHRRGMPGHKTDLLGLSSTLSAALDHVAGLG